MILLTMKKRELLSVQPLSAGYVPRTVFNTNPSLIVIPLWGLNIGVFQGLSGIPEGAFKIQL